MATSLNFFDDPFGRRRTLSLRNRQLGFVTDPLYATGLALNSSFRSLDRDSAALKKQRVLIAAVEVPERRAALDALLGEMQRTRHEVSIARAELGNRGKFHNIRMALEGRDLSAFDWLIVTDDDIALPPNFLDRFLYVANKAGFKLCQPAHCFNSWASFDVTLRRFASMARTTGFVECGPLTAFHRDTFPLLLPFPTTRWAWGIDLHWVNIARRENFPIGIVDATPIRHLRRPGASYDMQAAADEGKQYMADNGVALGRPDVLKTIQTFRRF